MIFKIYESKGVSLRYSLIMALLGIIIVISSLAIDGGYSSRPNTFKFIILMFGVVYTAYGGIVSINKYIKDKDKRE